MTEKAYRPGEAYAYPLILKKLLGTALVYSPEREIVYRDRTADTAPVLSYDLEYFQQFEPLTVGDMLKRVPGVGEGVQVLGRDVLVVEGDDGAGEAALPREARDGAPVEDRHLEVDEEEVDVGAEPRERGDRVLVRLERDAPSHATRGTRRPRAPRPGRGRDVLGNGQDPARDCQTDTGDAGPLRRLYRRAPSGQGAPEDARV